MSLAFASNRLKTSSTRRARPPRPVADLRVDQARGSRSDAVILDERARAEVAQPHAAEDARAAVDGDARRRSPTRPLPECGRRRIAVGEARARARDVGVERQPRRGRAVRWSTRRPTRGSAARPRSCRHLRRTAAPSRGRAATAATVVCSCGIADGPHADLCAVARGRAASRGRPARRWPGSTAIVAPRASLLWKPMPPLT